MSVPELFPVKFSATKIKKLYIKLHKICNNFKYENKARTILEIFPLNIFISDENTK